MRPSRLSPCLGVLGSIAFFCHAFDSSALDSVPIDGIVQMPKSTKEEGHELQRRSPKPSDNELADQYFPPVPTLGFAAGQRPPSSRQQSGRQPSLTLGRAGMISGSLGHSNAAEAGGSLPPSERAESHNRRPGSESPCQESLTLMRQQNNLLSEVRDRMRNGPPDQLSAHSTCIRGWRIWETALARGQNTVNTAFTACLVAGTIIQGITLYNRGPTFLPAAIVH